MNRVQSDLEQLAGLDITPLDTPEPELAYLFKHIVTHEVTYESLPFATRAQLHEQLAKYLEGIAAPVDTIAHHYGQSNNQAKQREYYQKAAESALAEFANNAAADYFVRLLELVLKSDPARSALALQLATVYFSLGNFPAARAAVLQAQAAAQTDADRASALALLGNVTSALGNYAEAQTNLAEAVSLARASGDRLALSRALVALGGLYYFLGKLDDARVAGNESLDLARALGDVNRELSSLTLLGLAATGTAKAEEYYKEVIARAVGAGNRERAMTALGNLGGEVWERQEYTAAHEYTQQALVLAREIGAQKSIALFHINLGYLDIKLGEFAAARKNLREGLALAQRLGTLPLVGEAVMYFGNLAHAEGQTEQALALFGLARNQPAWNSENQGILDTTLAESALDPSVVEAGMKKGAEPIGKLHYGSC
jgi:tetratricopeptide (TPR) repeat protein